MTNFKTTKIPHLQQLLDDGWRVHMHGAMKLEKAPIADEKKLEILEATKNTATHIIFMDNSNTNEKMIFPICNQPDLELAQKEAKEQKKIIGYKVRVGCVATVSDAQVDTTQVAKSIGDLMKCEVQSPDEQEHFYVFFDIEGDNKEIGTSKILELKELLIAASIKNKTGYFIKNIGWGPLYKGQPFAIWPGRITAIQQPICSKDIDIVQQFKDNNKDEILSLLCQFYGQVSVSSKVIYGFSLLEELYAGNPKHILTKSEKKEVVSVIGGIQFSCEHEKKQEKIKDILLNPNIMSKENRNERIAQNISPILGMPIDEAIDRIKAISKLRAASAHPTEKTSIKEDNSEFKEAFLYIDSVIMKIH